MKTALPLLVLATLLACSKEETVPSSPVEPDPAVAEAGEPTRTADVRPDAAASEAFRPARSLGVISVSDGGLAHGLVDDKAGFGDGAGGSDKGTVKVRLAVPTITGPMDGNMVRRFVRRNLKAIAACYETRLRGQATLPSGTVVVSFRIEPDGAAAAAKGEGISPAVAGCVAHIIVKIQFPKPHGEGGVVVSFPIVFDK